MKKILSYITIFHILFINLSLFTFQTVQASSPIYADDNYFVVTAYYSPLPNQKYYFKWSYEADIKLNGRWVTWASGKPVFPGMFAAPKSYPFGSKIYLEWIWVWEVADRWGAIVSTNPSETRGYSYDRIDIWMWYGDEWLARALQFGKQTIKWNVLANSSTPVSINLNSFSSPEKILAKYKVKNKETLVVAQTSGAKTTSTKKSLLSFSIDPNKPGISETKKLQEVFKSLDLYTWEINGDFSSIKDTLITYQVHAGVIPSKTHKEAGYFWQKTAQALEKDLIVFAQEKQNQEDMRKEIESKVNSHIASIGSPKVWDVWENVRHLQNTLKTLGYFQQKDTAIYGPQTQDALVEYQIKKWIISGKTDIAAGVFGPKTKEHIKKDLQIALEKHLIQSSNILSFKK